jgi:sterol desaturase/sphingolipid hydroxylase (fatty acid hydroxylase superfamily)
VRRVLCWLVLPLFLGASMSGLAIALARGLPAGLVLFGGGAACAGAIALGERFLPFAPDWQRSRGDVLTDLLHLAVTGGLIETLPALAVGGRPPLLWPATWPVAAQAGLALVLADLFNYGTHRLMHGPLWRFHAVHHSTPRLYWLNSWRVHPVEGLLYFGTTVVPLALLGVPERPLLFVAAFSTVFRMLQHSNIDVRTGPLTWIFSTAELHRWHHSPHRAEAEANYGNVLAVWDVLLGTRALPDRRPPLEVGLPGGEAFPPGYGGQLLAPFRR